MLQVSSAGDAAGDVATLLKTVRKVAIDGKSLLLFNHLYIAYFCTAVALVQLMLLPLKAAHIPHLALVEAVADQCRSRESSFHHCCSHIVLRALRFSLWL
jgi:hypothetical protein